MSGRFDIVAVGQRGRLEYEAVLLAASLRACDPGFAGRLWIAEPQPGPLWPEDPRMASEGVRAALASLGAEILPFESRAFGAAYPHGNKIEALEALPEDRPFLFLDTDTLVTGPLSAIPFDFGRPSASMRREPTWPQPPLYGPGIGEIWRALYARFGLDFESSLDPGHPEGHWERYLYFNAGWFHYRSGPAFGRLLRHHAVTIREDPPEALAAQSLDPWLDQVALPLTIHALGGGRPGPDLAGLHGETTCHWRALPLLYAREGARTVALLEEIAAPNRIKKVLKEYEPFLRTIYQGRGRKARALFEGAPLPRPERALRQRLRKAGLWMR